MRKLFIFLLLLSFCFGRMTPAYSQKSAVMKKIAKTAVVGSAKTSAKTAGKAVAKDAGKEIAEQYTKRMIRKEVLETAEKKGSKTLAAHWISQTRKQLKNQTVDFSKSFGSHSARSKAYKTRLKYSRKGSGKVITKKSTLNSAGQLVTLYCGKDGVKRFMSLSIKDRMVNIKAITKHVFSLPEAERKKILASMSEPMRNKVVRMRELMTSRMPPKTSPKGRWAGERGNSDFILNDNYVWNGQSVRDLKRKYNIKGELRVQYRDGEPIFDKSNSLASIKIEYKQNYNYKDLKDLHDPINEKLSKEKWVQAKADKKAINPTRDYIENAAVDGSRVSGARNTYHEAMDGETIYIVPDFIHQICTHNGGRSVAALVQTL